MSYPRSSSASAWLRGVRCAASALSLGAALTGCVHEKVEVRTLPSRRPPTRSSVLDPSSVRLRVVISVEAPPRPAPASAGLAAGALAPGAQVAAAPGGGLAPPSAAFPLETPPAWGLQLRVERVHSCRVTEVSVLERELVTHFSPTWVVYAFGFGLLGTGIQHAREPEARSEVSIMLIGGGAAILASTLLFRTDAAEPIAPVQIEHVAVEPCGITPDGPHRLTFGPTSAVRRVLIPQSGARFLAGVTPEMFESVFLDGKPVEVVRSPAQPSAVPPSAVPPSAAPSAGPSTPTPGVGPAR